MKRTFLTLAILSLGLLAFSQTDTLNIKNSDTTKVKVLDEWDELENMNSETNYFDEDNNYKWEYSLETDDWENIKEGKFSGLWSGFEMGVNNFVNPNGSMKLSKENSYLNINNSRSYEFSLNVYDFSLSIFDKYIGLTSGVGITMNNYRFENNTTLINSLDSLSYSTDTIYNYQKNKLTAFYLKIPLLLEFNIPVNHNRLSIAAGVIGGIKFASYTKQVYNGFKEVKGKDFHTNLFKYELTARVGYGNVNLFANYALSTLFNKNEGPELYPVSMGIGLRF